jgi:hypothetical protein
MRRSGFCVVPEELRRRSNLARPEHWPGELAPAAGTYEQLNIFGRPTGIRVNVQHGHPLPPAPMGHNWTPADEDAAEC